VIAATFHFPASQIWDMDARDLTFWVRQAEWINAR
jgi:hypothetical protein